MIEIDGGTVEAFVESVGAVPVVLPTDFTDVGAMGKLVFDAIENRNWGLVASLLVVFVIAAGRRWIPEHTKVGKFLASRLGAILTNFGISFGGAFATMFLASAQFDIKMIWTALTVALTASGGWAIWKNVRDAIAEKKAANAGGEVAADPKKVEEELNK